MFWFLLIVIIGFTCYALVTQYANTDPAASVPKRIWMSVAAAAAATGALVMGWIKGGVTP